MPGVAIDTSRNRGTVHGVEDGVCGTPAVAPVRGSGGSPYGGRRPSAREADPGVRGAARGRLVHGRSRARLGGLRAARAIGRHLAVAGAAAGARARGAAGRRRHSRPSAGDAGALQLRDLRRRGGAVLDRPRPEPGRLPDAASQHPGERLASRRPQHPASDRSARGGGHHGRPRGPDRPGSGRSPGGRPGRYHGRQQDDVRGTDPGRPRAAVRQGQAEPGRRSRRGLRGGGHHARAARDRPAMRCLRASCRRCWCRQGFSGCRRWAACSPTRPRPI